MAALLYFEDEAAVARRAAQAAGLEALAVTRHRFPDGELRLQLPLRAKGQVDRELVVYRSLHQPNEKLVELLLLCQEARTLGATRILLVAPYLAYMRQDMAFHPGEVVSQRVVGRFLAELCDGLITVDPHLHRIHSLDEAVPLPAAISLSGAPKLAELIGHHHTHPLLIGPDAESAQWIQTAAAVLGCDQGVCTKVRHGDHDVEIRLPDLDVSKRAVVLLDDVASSGRTLAEAARQLRAAGAASVDVAVTHALFAHDALDVIRAAGVRHVWSTDCIVHDSNAIQMAPWLAEPMRAWLRAST